MTVKNFHVVCEGVTDFEVFKAVIKTIGKRVGAQFKAHPLFPPVKHKSNGGWGNLKNWCLSQAGALAGQNNRLAAARLLNGNPTPWATSRPADRISAALALTGGGDPSFILIQIDTDIAEHLARELDLGDKIDFPLSPRSRMFLCELALDTWLQGHVSRKGTQIFYCLTSLALENWILTLHPPSVLKSKCGLHHSEPYDYIHQPEAHLIRLGYSKDSDGTLRKSQHLYKQYGAELAAQLTSSRKRAFLLDHLCNTLIVA